jgi:hypothetical protein
VGGICSTALAVVYVLLILGRFVLPAPLRSTADMVTWLNVFAVNSTVQLLLYFLLGISGFFALGALPAFQEALQDVNEGMARWATNVGLAGFVVTSIEAFRFLALRPLQAGALKSPEPAGKIIAVAVEPIIPLDLAGWLQFGAVGFWLLTVGWLAQRSGRVPRGVSMLGIAAGVFNILVNAGLVYRSGALVNIAGTAAAGLTIAFFALAGTWLRGQAKA